MEKLISAIIVIAISVIYSWIKERSASREEKRKPSAPPPPPETEWPSDIFNAGAFDVVPLTVPPPVEVPAEKMPKPEKRHKKHHQPILPVEGGRVTPPSVLTETESTAPSRVDETASPALAAHYARWRQSVIDAEVLTPKF